MVKTKTIDKEEIEEIKEEVQEETDTDNYEEVYEDESDLEDDNEVIDSSLEIGGQIHTQSPIIKKFIQLPKDVKYSKFNNIDLANYTLKSRTYQLWNYLKKIQIISKDELTEIKEIKKQIYDIETIEDLKEHLENTQKGHIWHNLTQTLTPEQLNKSFISLKQQLAAAKESGVIDYIYGDKENFYSSYNNYLQENNASEEIDDFGLMSSMMTITEIKKAHAGWATKMMNTTINVTKEEDLSDDTEEEPEKREGFSKLMKK